jgi:hypothetical protein
MIVGVDRGRGCRFLRAHRPDWLVPIAPAPYVIPPQCDTPARLGIHFDRPG